MFLNGLFCYDNEYLQNIYPVHCCHLLFLSKTIVLRNRLRLIYKNLRSCNPHLLLKSISVSVVVIIQGVKNFPNVYDHVFHLLAMYLSKLTLFQDDADDFNNLFVYLFLSLLLALHKAFNCFYALSYFLNITLYIGPAYCSINSIFHVLFFRTRCILYLHTYY